MADVITFLTSDSRQQIPKEFASDMMCMVGWEDSEDTKYCTRDEKTNELIPCSILLNSDRYISYFGDDTVVLAISDHRNITIALDVKKFEIEEAKDFDYFIRTYHLSSILTEIDFEDLGLKVHRIDDKWILLQWFYLDCLFEAHISIDL